MVHSYEGAWLLEINYQKDKQARLTVHSGKTSAIGKTECRQARGFTDCTSPNALSNVFACLSSPIINNKLINVSDFCLTQHIVRCISVKIAPGTVLFVHCQDTAICNDPVFIFSVASDGFNSLFKRTHANLCSHLTQEVSQRLIMIILYKKMSMFYYEIGVVYIANSNIATPL